jgi:hypothetical protein
MKITCIVGYYSCHLPTNGHAGLDGHVNQPALHIRTRPSFSSLGNMNDYAKKIPAHELVSGFFSNFVR